MYVGSSTLLSLRRKIDDSTIYRSRQQVFLKLAKKNTKNRTFRTLRKRRIEDDDKGSRAKDPFPQTNELSLLPHLSLRPVCENATKPPTSLYMRNPPNSHRGLSRLRLPLCSKPAEININVNSMRFLTRTASGEKKTLFPSSRKMAKIVQTKMMLSKKQQIIKITNRIENHDLYIFLTFWSATMHRDSRSRHFESLKHFSNCLLIKTPISDWRPASKWGAAIGFNSTKICNLPSFGRATCGGWMSQETFATTL